MCRQCGKCHESSTQLSFLILAAVVLFVHLLTCLGKLLLTSFRSLAVGSSVTCSPKYYAYGTQPSAGGMAVSWLAELGS